jgi:hypothetical protein
MTSPEVVCTMCDTGAPAIDGLRTGDQVYAVCVACERKNPTYIRRTGSALRILGFDVEDVRGLLR